MERTLVAGPGDRFLDQSSATGSVGSKLRLIVGAALGSLLLHGLVSLGPALLDRPFGPVSVSIEIPIEVVVEVAQPARSQPVRAKNIIEPEIVQAPSPSLEPPAPQLATALPAPPPRAEWQSPLGLDQENLRAVAVPVPAEWGDEAMRYDVVVVGSLERAKQFPKQASRRRARGTAVVGFALDETGRVLVAALLRSSGDRELDDESLAVIARAAPFPKPPPGARRKFAVDIAFGMGG